MSTRSGMAWKATRSMVASCPGGAAGGASCETAGLIGNVVKASPMTVNRMKISGRRRWEVIGTLPGSGMERGRCDRGRPSGRPRSVLRRPVSRSSVLVVHALHAGHDHVRHTGHDRRRLGIGVLRQPHVLVLQLLQLLLLLGRGGGS